MLQKVALLGILALMFSGLTGCGKAEIASECSLAGNGDYKCNFKNKGSAEGSACEHLLLFKKTGASGGFLFEGEALKNTYEKLASVIPAAAKKNGMTPDQFVHASGSPSFAAIVFAGKGQGLSNEICSGLVKGGDIREVNGTARFSPESRMPVDICISYNGSWTDTCGFSSISPDEVKKAVDQAVASASK